MVIFNAWLSRSTIYTIQFVGITLANDPNPQFDIAPGPKAKKIDISLERVLGDFQKDEDRCRGAGHRTSLDRFALLGFGRYNPRNLDAVKYPYKRGHVYSAMILNLELLRENEVYYDPDIYIWEDIEFNERVNNKGLMICKIQRYMQRKKQMIHGGCNGNIARPDPVPVPVNSDLASWLDGLSLSTSVLSKLEGEGIKVKDDLVGLEKTDLRSIGINLGDANKIHRAINKA